MALVLKSNSSLKPSVSPVGNIHGYSGPSDYRAMLDFTCQRYRLDGSDLSFDDVATLTRNSKGRYTDIFGRWQEADFNEPRFHYMAEEGEAGVLLEGGVTNGLTSSANGASFSVANAGTKVTLSFAGTGDATISGAGITSLGTTFYGGGRTHKVYNRSGPASGTISVSGDVEEAMVYNGTTYYAYTPFGTVVSGETLRLSESMVALIAGGTGTIICRYKFTPDANVDRSVNPVSIRNGNSPAGGINAGVAARASGLGTSSVSVFADASAANTGEQVTSILGNRPPASIGGMFFSGFGANLGIIANGQAARGVPTSVTPPTALTEIYLGIAAPGMYSFASSPNAILTHCVIYDRMVSDEEAFNMSTAWKS